MLLRSSFNVENCLLFSSIFFLKCINFHKKNLFTLGKLDEVKVLIKNGAIIEAHTSEGDTAIDLAYEKGMEKLFQSVIGKAEVYKIFEIIKLKKHNCTLEKKF